MLKQNKEFYKLVEKLVGSQFAAENGIMYELDMDLVYIDQLEKNQVGSLDYLEGNLDLTKISAKVLMSWLQN